VTESTRGGARPGAGRKPSTDPLSRMIFVRVTESDAQTFERLGGSKWFRETLRKAGSRVTKLRTVR
jgi:hypothetical protein